MNKYKGIETKCRLVKEHGRCVRKEGILKWEYADGCRVWNICTDKWEKVKAIG